MLHKTNKQTNKKQKSANKILRSNEKCITSEIEWLHFSGISFLFLVFQQIHINLCIYFSHWQAKISIWSSWEIFLWIADLLMCCVCKGKKVLFEMQTKYRRTECRIGSIFYSRHFVNHIIIYLLFHSKMHICCIQWETYSLVCMENFSKFNSITKTHKMKSIIKSIVGTGTCFSVDKSRLC